MNAVSRIALPQALPPRLLELVNAMAPSRYDGDSPLVIQRRVAVSDDDRQAARLALPAAEAALRPASPEDVLEWLLVLNGAVANTLALKALQERSRGISDMLDDLPAAAWSPESRKAAIRAFKFFPAVAELAAHLEPFAQAARNTVARLKRIVDAPYAASPDPEADARRAEREAFTALPQAERDAVFQAMRERAREAQEPAQTVRAAPLARLSPSAVDIALGKLGVVGVLRDGLILVRDDDSPNLQQRAEATIRRWHPVPVPQIGVVVVAAEDWTLAIAGVPS